MRKTKFQKVTAFALALVFLLCAGLVPVSASDSVGQTGGTADEMRELLNAISYKDYIALYSNSKDTENFVPVATQGVSVLGKDGVVSADIDLGKLSAEQQAALTEADRKNYAAVNTYDGIEGLYVPGSGSVVWTLDTALEQYAALKNAGRYYLEIDYYAVPNKSTSIERLFMINGKVPFSEARYLTISKNWQNTYENAIFEVPKDENADTYVATAKAAGFTDVKTEERDGTTYIIYTIPTTWTPSNAGVVDDQVLRFFLQDIDKNEIRATLSQTPVWQTYQFKDSNGFVQTPFEFVIAPDENGKVTLTLESVNEPIVISEIRLVQPTALMSYADYAKQYENVATGTGKIKIEAEYYYAASSQTIYPVTDNTSAITSPASTKFTVLNTLGGDKWQNPGQWISYKFKVDQTGMYKIATRFRQNILDGMYSSRILSLYGGSYDGVPFAEANRLRFNYSSDWQAGYLTDGTTEFEFYFEAGVEYTLRLEVSLGDMGDIVSRVQASLNSINNDYLNILKLTGADPDEDRDYGFSRVMPDVMRDMIIQKRELEAVSALLNETAGVKSSMSADLDKVSRLLGVMGYSDDQVAKNLDQLKSYIGTLGTWLSNAKTQPLVLDYLVIQNENEDLPRAKANFWQSIVYEISSFFQSFFRNYDRVGAMSMEESEDTVEVWLAYGRDQAQVIRGLVNNDFTPQYHVPINLKLVSGGTLLPSILAGKGPDVYIGIGQADIINYAIRGALEPIENMPDFAEVTSDFNESAMMVLGIADKDNVYHCYGLPETQSFPMMFVRTDVLADLGQDVPETWDDVKALIPVLQANNMLIGMAKNANMFIYQMGGELFADDGMRINLDSNVSLEAFETMCDMFTMYSFPYKYDFANRFRTGEMPIGFADYTTTYNQLKVFATEIEGLWEFRPLPGYYIDGKLNNKSVSTVSAIAMITGCENKDGAWKFMRWHSGSQCQIDYSNEMVAILGPSAKHPTANRQALASLPWTTSEYTQLRAQFENLAAIPNYPGAYIVDRYTNFAFLAAFNNNANPVVELQSYINIINKEITRKRTEFELETLDYVGQTLAQKRMASAETKLKDAMEASAYNEAAYKATCDNVLLVMEGYTTEDYASLRALADALDELNKDLFGAATADMRSAADALESYEAYK